MVVDSVVDMKAWGFAWGSITHDAHDWSISLRFSLLFRVDIEVREILQVLFTELRHMWYE